MANSGLDIGPVRLKDRIDPSDPNELGGLGSETGSGYDSLEIIQRNAAEHAKLGPYLSLPPDIAATLTLDKEEVEKVVGQPVEGASVRGRDEGAQKVVIFLVRPDGPFGRSAKGVIKYEDLPKSEKARKEFLDREEQAAEAARAAVPDPGFGMDPRVIQLEQENARLKAALAENERLNAQVREATE